MPQRWKSFLLSLLVVPLVLVSCKRQYSSDDPLPAVYTPSIIVGSDNQVVYAFDPINGNKNWELTLPTPIKASPIIYGGMVYICGYQRNNTGPLIDTVYKVNAKTGVIVKKITAPADALGNAITGTPVADANLLYVPTTNGYLYVFDTGSGNLKWYYYTGGSAIESSPLIYNGKVYFATVGGTVYCLNKTLGGTDAATGSYTPEIWTLNVPGASFYSSPAASAPYLYIGSTTDSNMYCMDLEVPSTTVIGNIRWTYKTKGAIYSSPAAVAGTCIFGCNDLKIYCLDTSIDPDNGIFTPEARWIDSTHGLVRSSPVVYNQVVYVGSDDYYLYALNIINGTYKWKFKSRGLIKSSPLPYRDVIYVGSYDKNLYALDSATGTVKWTKNINGEIQCSPVIDDLTKLSGYNSQISGFTN